MSEAKERPCPPAEVVSRMNYNLMLAEWFQKNRISTRDFGFDTIYVNGSDNLPNLKLNDENWKVRLIEEEFMKRMWNVG